jgi:hypothetical protein
VQQQAVSQARIEHRDHYRVGGFTLTDDKANMGNQALVQYSLYHLPITHRAFWDATDFRPANR